MARFVTAVFAGILIASSSAFAQEPKQPVPDAIPPSTDMAMLARSVKYPEEARKNGIQGRVYVSVLIDTTGKPVKGRIDDSDNNLLNDAAMSAVMSAQFEPAVQDGKKIRLWVTVPISFKLE